MGKTYTTMTNAIDKRYGEAYEQDLLDKFNAATTAQFNLQREQNRQAENAYYNQMYNTQKTAMDTIRQNNAAAVATGASRGVQAANELSAILGLQQESVAGATEVAQARRQTAQEETAAVLENVLKAYQQAETTRQNERQAFIEAMSVENDKIANLLAAEAGNSDYENRLQGELGLGENNTGGEKPQDNNNNNNTNTDNNTNSNNTNSNNNNNTNTDNNTNSNNTNSNNSNNNDVTYTTVKYGTAEVEEGSDGSRTVKTSGYDPDNDQMYFTSKADSKEIYNVLGQAGVKYDKQMIIDLSKITDDDKSEYDKIKQKDLSSTEQGGEAILYLQAIQDAAENNEIPIGARVVLNYGKVDGGGSNYECIYVGNGKFAWVDPTFRYADSINTNNLPIWLPNGYTTGDWDSSSNGWIITKA